MQPLGTITKYYPFLEGEVQSTLDSLMNESSSHYDFILRLVDFVSRNDVSTPLAYIAAVQSWFTRDEPTVSRIQAKYGHIKPVKVWGFVVATIASDQVRKMTDFQRALQAALGASKDDWMQVEMHLLHSFFHFDYQGDIQGLLKPLEDAKRCMNRSHHLEIFGAFVSLIGGRLKEREGNIEGAYDDYETGLGLARAINDSFYEYMNLEAKARVAAQLSIEESFALFDETYSLVKSLKIPYLICETLNDMAYSFETAGEYDLAMSCHTQMRKETDWWDGKEDSQCLAFSRIYATMGRGSEALEWIDHAFDLVGTATYPDLYIAKSNALALLGRVKEAEALLDIVGPQVMKTGQELLLGRYYYASGLLELAKGDILTANRSLEDAQEIFSRYGNVLMQNQALLALAKAEMLNSNRLPRRQMSTVPGKWLTKLESHAQTHHLPGIKLQVALLKSEFYENQQLLGDAYETLHDALDSAGSLAFRTLRTAICTRMSRLYHIMRDRGLLPDGESG